MWINRKNCLTLHKKDWIMAFNLITDKDFVSPHYLYCASLLEEPEKELYQIVYGVLHDKMTFDDICDLVVRVSKEMKNDVVKRFKLKTIKEDIELIIKNLRKYEDVDKFVIVTIPFTDDYEHAIDYTISQFQLVLFTINEILEKGDEHMTINEEPNYTYPVKDMETLLVDFLFYYVDRVMSDEFNDYELNYWTEIIFDEMIRRGIPITPKQLLQSDCHVPYKKSQYYGQSKLFLETVSFGRRLKLKITDEPDNTVPTNVGGKTVNVKEETRLIYFMLKCISQDVFEKSNKKNLVNFINYLVGNTGTVENSANSNVWRYINEFNKITSKSEPFQFYKSMSEKLKEFGFNNPEVIKEGLENKGHTPVR